MSSKVAIVTGNGRGLGEAISNYLINHGYKKPEVIRSKDYNLKNYEDCERLVKNIQERYGHVDLLVNNVGNYETGYIDKFSIESWHEMLDSNLNSAFYMSKLCIQDLRANQGKIINIGYCGLEKLSPPPDHFAYQIAKTGLLTLTKAMAKEEAQHGVTVNMISPGSLENTVETKDILEKIPMKRFGSLDEAVNLVDFFLNNSYVTGQNLELAGARAL
jgi:NAD(P)-dependent dehydrogenase (short-subunit alcohol dehydrogenase family)